MPAGFHFAGHHRIDGGIQRGDGNACLLKKRRAFFSQTQLTRGAVHQTNAQRLLKPGNIFADGGGTHSLKTRGGGEATRIGSIDK